MPKTFKKKPNYILLVFIFILASLIIWNLRTNLLIGQLSTETVGQGWIKHEKIVQAVFANTEIILIAPAEGKIVLPNEEGKRFRKGETIIRMVPTGVGHEQSKEEVLVIAPISGLFFSYKDGLEQVITPENLMNMDLKELLAQVKNTQPNPIDENSVSIHSPVGKMVNNLYPSWMFVYLDPSDNLVKGDAVKFSTEGEEYQGIVMKLSEQPRGAVVRFSQFVKGTPENRSKNITWINKPPTKGLLVPISSICTFGEEKGVYIKDEGVIRHSIVQVLDSNDAQACVEGIPEGARVIINPKKGIEGLVVKK